LRPAATSVEPIARPTSTAVYTTNIKNNETNKAKLPVSSSVNVDNKEWPVWYMYTMGSIIRPISCVTAPASGTRCARTMSKPPKIESDSATNSEFKGCAYRIVCVIVQPMSALVALLGWRSARRLSEMTN